MIFTKKNVLILIAFNILIYSYTLISRTPIMTEKSCKNYIIEHQYQIVEENDDDPDERYFRIITDDLNYYEEITIRAKDDSFL